MKFAEDNLNDGYVITAYDSDYVAVNGKNFRQSMILQQTRMQQAWPVTDISQLQAAHIEQILDFSPEVVIIGTGDKLIFPATEIYAGLIRQGIGVEFMDTGAACRTYNILSGEGRNVVAGIILPE